MQTRTVAAVLVLLAACAQKGPTARIETRGGRVDVALEVAATPETRSRGLMYRRELADGHGMLFVFDDDANHEFWMKNTLIPLDMIFITVDGHVAGVRKNATPMSTAEISVGTPSRYVLEVPGGWAERRGVAVGDRVEFVGVAEART
jgi:uncharacterized membrane protein (UPF0127 family)